MFGVPKKIFDLHKEKTELGSVDRLLGDSLGARYENDKLRLSHHAVKFHC